MVSVDRFATGKLRGVDTTRGGCPLAALGVCAWADGRLQATNRLNNKTGIRRMMDLGSDPINLV